MPDPNKQPAQPNRQSARRKAQGGQGGAGGQPAPRKQAASQGTGSHPAITPAGGQKAVKGNRRAAGAQASKSTQKMAAPARGGKASKTTTGLQAAARPGSTPQRPANAPQRAPTRRSGKSGRAGSSGKGGKSDRVPAAEGQPLKKRGLGLAAKFSIPVCFLIAVAMGAWGYWVSQHMQGLLMNDIKKNGINGIKELTEIAQLVLVLKEQYPARWPLKAGFVSPEELEAELGAEAEAQLRYFEEVEQRLQKGGEEALESIEDLTEAERSRYDRAQAQTQKLAKMVSQKGVLRNLLQVEVEGQDTVANEILDMYVAQLGRPLLTARPTVGDLELKFAEEDSTVALGGGEHELQDIEIKPGSLSTGGRTELIYSFNRELGIPFRGRTLRGNVYLVLSGMRIDEQMGQLRTIMIAVGGAAVVLAAVICYLVAWIVTTPVHTLVRDMDRVSQGDLSHQTRAHSSDEIGAIAMQFNEMTRKLAIAQEAQRENQRYEDELEMAREIQIKLLPPKLPHIRGLDIFATYHPAKEVGGDYYDLFPIDKEHLGIIVADVSGKGIPGSMVMATTRTILRFVAVRNTSAASTLARTNQVVAADIRRGMFVTAFYLVLNVRNHQMCAASAGHNPMAVYRASSGEVELVNPSGIALGFDKGPLFEKTIKDQSMPLNPGDRAVLYTDGVVEAMNEQSEEYSDERFYDFVRDNSEASSEDFVKGLLADLEDHKGRAEQHDDITIVTFRAG